MYETDKTVLRFNDGKILRGYVRNFNPHADAVMLQEAETGKVLTFDVHLLKAVFFVKSFEGDRYHREKKSYGTSKIKGHRIFIKFKDKEDMVGFLDGDVPWKKGFFLSKNENSMKGFYVLPVDEDSNNVKAFVISSAVSDVTVIP